MAGGDNSMSSLLNGTQISQSQQQKIQGNGVSAGVAKLTGIGNRSDALFASGEAKANNLTAAQKTQIEADAMQAEVNQAYVKSTLNASGINGNLMQEQGQRNVGLDKVIGDAQAQYLEADKKLNDPDSGFMDRLTGFFQVSKAEERLKSLSGMQAVANQQTTNTLNVVNSTVAAINAKAIETSKQQRDATANTAVATAEFNGFQNLAKVTSDQIQIQTQILSKQMTATELSASQSRLSQQQYQMTKMKEADQMKGQWVQTMNQKFGTSFTPSSYDAAPDGMKVMFMQVGSGASPIQKPTETIATLNAMGVTNDRIESQYPGIMQKAAIYTASEQEVNQRNLTLGAKPTAPQLEAQVAAMVKSTTITNDKTLASLGAAEPDSPVWSNVPKDVMAAVQPIVVKNIQAIQSSDTGSQVDIIAKGLFEAAPNQTAKQLADKLNPLIESLRANMTNTLQSQGISNDGYGIPVTLSTPGFFGTKTAPMVLSRPADTLTYASSIIASNQNATIKAGMGNGSVQSAPYQAGNQVFGMAYANPSSRAVYERAMRNAESGAPKVDTTK